MISCFARSQFAFIDQQEEADAQGVSFIMTALGIIAAVTLMLAAAL